MPAVETQRPSRRVCQGSARRWAETRSWNKRDEYLAARDAMQGLSDRYQRLLDESERAGYVHLREARVFSPGDPPLPGNGMYRRGRL